MGTSQSQRNRIRRNACSTHCRPTSVPMQLEVGRRNTQGGVIRHRPWRIEGAARPLLFESVRRAKAHASRVETYHASRHHQDRIASVRGGSPPEPRIGAQRRRRARFDRDRSALSRWLRRSPRAVFRSRARSKHSPPNNSTRSSSAACTRRPQSSA
jgi:hypothetical protein